MSGALDDLIDLLGVGRWAAMNRRDRAFVQAFRNVHLWRVPEWRAHLAAESTCPICVKARELAVDAMSAVARCGDEAHRVRVGESESALSRMEGQASGCCRPSRAPRGGEMSCEFCPRKATEHVLAAYQDGHQAWDHHYCKWHFKIMHPEGWVVDDPA